MVSTTAVDNFTLLAWNPAIPPSSTPAPPGTSAPATPEAHLHSRIKESVTGHRVLLVLGTGVTMGLLHRNTPPLASTPLLSQEHQDLLNSSWNGRHQLARRHASWDGLVSSLAQSVSWGDDQGGEESLKYLMCAVAEMGRAESTVLAGVAHPLQRRLRQEAKWDALIREKIRMLDDFLDHSSAWAQLFQHIGNQVSSPPPAARPPLIVTTNYDDLIAKLCKLKVLCVKSQTPAPPAGSSHRLALFTPTHPAAGSGHPGPPGVTISTGTPPPGPTTTTATTSSSTTTGPLAASAAPPDHLANFHKAEEFWTLYEQGLLENHECFVHHLHGWWDEPNSIVLDAADYANRVDTSPDQVLINRITSPNNLVIIAGMGAGLLDDHLGKILADAASSATPAFRRHAPSSPSSAAPSAPDDLCPTLTFWLVQKGDWRKGLSKVFKSLVARMGHQAAPPPTTSAATATAATTTDRLATKAAQLLSVVLVDDFDQMPQIIRAILDGNPGSFSKLTLPPAP